MSKLEDMQCAMKAGLSIGGSSEARAVKLLKFAELVRAAERERCAMVCEALPGRGSVYDAATLDCAAAIRGPNGQIEPPRAAKE